MPTPRFFIDAPTDAFQLGGRFELPPKTARHAGRSLRLAAGEIVELFNGTGAAWSGPVGFSDASAWVELEHRTDRTAESPLAITLLQSLVAPEKADWIVEKAVEAGISEIIFMPAERSVTKLAGERLEKRLARLTDIARSAAEQCGRNVVPLVRAVPSLEAGFKTVSGDVKFVLAPGADASAASSMLPGLRRLCRRTRGRVLCSRNRARRRSRLAASASGAACSAHGNRRTGRGYLGSDTCR
jgi:16S rRNA (uracil1498-N3)-methyltransferase